MSFAVIRVVIFSNFSIRSGFLFVPFCGSVLCFLWLPFLVSLSEPSIRIKELNSDATLAVYIVGP